MQDSELHHQIFLWVVWKKEEILEEHSPDATNTFRKKAEREDPDLFFF